uniref:Uncharacterized protein n=1 Tax=Timema shepardi TaxID=629360 RepID=A0A7R9B8Z5_TIMSH|nr:unnamed protein product [Timema shepardi]
MHESCGEASSPRQVKVQTPPHPSYGGGHQATGAPGRTVGQDHQVCVCSEAQVRHLDRQDHGHCAKKRSVPRSSQVRKKTPSLTCARVLRNSTAPRG